MADATIMGLRINNLARVIVKGSAMGQRAGGFVVWGSVGRGRGGLMGLIAVDGHSDCPVGDPGQLNQQFIAGQGQSGAAGSWRTVLGVTSISQAQYSDIEIYGIPPRIPSR